MAININCKSKLSSYLVHWLANVSSKLGTYMLHIADTISDLDKSARLIASDWFLSAAATPRLELESVVPETTAFYLYA